MKGLNMKRFSVNLDSHGRYKLYVTLVDGETLPIAIFLHFADIWAIELAVKLEKEEEDGSSEV